MMDWTKTVLFTAGFCRASNALMFVNLKDKVTNCSQPFGSHLIHLFIYQLYIHLIGYSHSLWPVPPSSFLPTVIILVLALPQHPYLPASNLTILPFSSSPKWVLHSGGQKTAAHRPSQPVSCFFMAKKPRILKKFFIWLHFKWLYKYYIIASRLPLGL